ncbi:holin [Mycolicibacterium peregrinum]|uniref:holin n=1 Tax=Mycolicibacterium peregrinum TaxID=43304 RepID=UPI000AA9F17C|nr:holin [Mycolicibacterium peregrinum]
MNTIWSLTFWKDAAERALKSAAQAATLALGGDVFNAWTVDWKTAAGIALGGAGLSLLTSIGSAGIANKGTASLSSAVEPAAPGE